MMQRKDNSQVYQQTTYDIYVGNVPKNINEADLRQLFIKYGEVKQVLCRWKEEYFGYAIVKFLSKFDAERVLRDIPEVMWNGHTMPVKMARRSDHNYQNGNGTMESKPGSYPEMNNSPAFLGSKFSNTDYGYFQPATYSEEMSGPSQPIMMEVLCTNVQDAITFYGCPVNRSDELMYVINALNSLNFSQKRLERKPLAKHVYAALFSEDNSWYRCSVIHSLPNKPGMCTVRYIDYGNQEETMYKNIAELPDSLQMIPPFASKFCFGNLVIETKVPSKKTYLHQLVHKRMSLWAYLTPTSLHYKVVKCSCNGKDIIAEITNKGFAKFQSTTIQKGDMPPYDYAPKSKHSSHGTEIKPKDYNGHRNQTLETQAVNNNTAKKVLKNHPKTKDCSPKNEELPHNGNTKETDFHPKMIIKRGSEITDIIAENNGVCAGSEKTPTQQNPLSLIDTVIPNIKLINNIRGLVSQSCDDTIINSAVDLLEIEVDNLELTSSAIADTESAEKDYMEILSELKNCSEKSILPSLKLKRDSCRSLLCDKLKDYLGKCDSSVLERKENIQKTITDLASNSNAWMNVQLDKKPASTEELVSVYKKVKEQRWNLVSKTRENTNQKHEQFMNVLAALQKEFYLNSSDSIELPNSTSSVNNISKAPSHSDSFSEALKDLEKAVDEEIHSLTLNKGTNNISVIQCLLDLLDVQKEKNDAVCELFENRQATYKQLSEVPDIELTLSELASVGNEVQNLTMQFSPAGNLEENEAGISPNMPLLMMQLHRILMKEDSLKEIVAKASESFFPELSLEHPELHLFSYTQNKYYLKNWKCEYFTVSEPGSRGKSSFASKLLEDLVDIKEYSFETTEELKSFIVKAVLWNEVKSDLLVKVKAMFQKDDKTMWVVLPPVSNTLLGCTPTPVPFEGEKACRILRQVLIALKDIHSQNFVHRAIHPATILLENDKAFLDFCFDSSYLDKASNLKGISFQPPETKAMHEAVDMYAFGCLVLWALFPNLSFTPTEDGVPNVSAFRSIIEEMISPKDFTLLSALVSANPERRPSSSTLLNKGFLSKYEAYCRLRCDNPKSA